MGEEMMLELMDGSGNMYTYKYHCNKVGIIIDDHKVSDEPDTGKSLTSLRESAIKSGTKLLDSDEILNEVKRRRAGDD